MRSGSKQSGFSSVEILEKKSVSLITLLHQLTRGQWVFLCLRYLLQCGFILSRVEVNKIPVAKLF